MAAPATLTAYQSFWRNFRNWGTSQGIPIPDPDCLTEPIAVDVIEAYINGRTDPNGTPLAPKTLVAHMAAIKHYHDRARLLSPTGHVAVRDALESWHDSSVHTPRVVRGLTPDDMTKVVRAIRAKATSTPKAARDEAMLLTGWCGRMERSALVGLDFADVRFSAGGWMFRLRNGRQFGGWQEGIQLADPLDAKAALRRWIDTMGAQDGPLFRQVDRWGNIRGRASDRSVERATKDAVAAAGGNPEHYAGRSLYWGPLSSNESLLLQST